MAHKTLHQQDLADALIPINPKLNIRLEKIDSLIDWKPFELILNRIYSSPMGRPSYPLLLLFKSLLLQLWYNLSDYGLEEALDDRLSFRRFTSLSFSQRTPDHSTLSRFREQLVRHKVKDLLFDELNRQLDCLGLFIKQGTLIDATIVESPASRPPKTPEGTAGKSEVDTEASWTKKSKNFLFGYKAHLGVDQGSGLVRKQEMTTAKVSDDKIFEKVISGDEDWVFADKAYDTKENVMILEEKGIKNGILMKGSLYNKLNETEKRCNGYLSKIRAPIESVFGGLKQWYRYRRGRYIGLKKNEVHLALICFCYNLRKVEKLCR